MFQQEFLLISVKIMYFYKFIKGLKISFIDFLAILYCLLWRRIIYYNDITKSQDIFPRKY